MRVIFSGGGTIGSVSPLLAIYQALKKQQSGFECLWLATKHGPETSLVKEYGLPVRRIFSGKFRRYFSLRNFFDPVLVLVGLIQSFFIILKFKPDIIVSAGGYVAVPVALAGWLLRVPSLIHQQDIIPSLTNKVLAAKAKFITVTFNKSLQDFPNSQSKTWLTGNPVRPEILNGNVQAAKNFFRLESNQPTILVMGGGTGSAKINHLVATSLDELLKFCQVIHITGGKSEKFLDHPNYHWYEFLTNDMPLAYAACDLVVSRAGLSTLTEIVALKKPAIIIPIAHSHQEANAAEFAKQQAAVVLAEPELTAEKFSAAIRQLLSSQGEQQSLLSNLEKVMPQPQLAAEKIVKLFL